LRRLKMSSKKKYFFIIDDAKRQCSLTTPTEYTSIINDIGFYIDENDKGFVTYIGNKQVAYYGGGIFISYKKDTSPLICDPRNVILFSEKHKTMPLELILMNLGYIVDTFPMVRSLLENKIATQFVLNQRKIPVLNFSVSIPKKEYPFICKTNKHEKGDKVSLIKDFTAFYKFLQREQTILCETYIDKDIQCSYKVLVYLHTPVACVLRVNDEKKEFSSESLWKKVVIPLSSTKSLEQVIIREFDDKMHMYNYDILSARSPSKDEVELMTDVCTQEGIRISRKGKPVIKLDKLNKLAREVSYVLRAGKCEIDFIKDPQSGKYYVIDANPDICKLWKNVFNSKSVSALIYQGLCKNNFFKRKFHKVGKT